MPAARGIAARQGGTDSGTIDKGSVPPIPVREDPAAALSRRRRTSRQGAIMPGQRGTPGTPKQGPSAAGSQAGAQPHPRQTTRRGGGQSGRAPPRGQESAAGRA
eukprot:5851699-Alexandrium_andersonii.AAC.1